MPKETPTVTFEGVMRDLKAGKYSSVYYLMGDESYYIDVITDWIAEHVLQPEERDFNQTVLYGPDVTAAQIVDAARRYPMMAEHQVVIVKEAQNIRDTEALQRYMKTPMASTILVMCHKNGKIDGRKRDYVKSIKDAGVLFESKKLKERDLPAFIERYLNERNASIDDKSTQVIADSIGSDLHRLVGELNKLLVALPESDRRVTPAVVERQIGLNKDFNIFELRRAIAQHDIYRVNLISNYFDNNPKAGGLFAMIPNLFSFFQNLMIAYYCPKRTSREELAAWLDLRQPWLADEYITAMKNYSAMKVFQIISKIREMDAKSKGLDNKSTPPEELSRELFYFILH